MKEDKELVKEVLSGSIHAFEEIMKRYEMNIMHFCYSMLRNKETAEDITQEVFITVYNKLYTFKREYKFSTWLYQIAKNRCIDQIRKAGKVQQLTLLEVGDETMSISPEEILEFKETKRTVQAFLASLNDVDRQILLLRYSRDNLTFSDIAQIMEMGESAVKKRYYKAYEKYERFAEDRYDDGLGAVCKG